MGPMGSCLLSSGNPAPSGRMLLKRLIQIQETFFPLFKDTKSSYSPMVPLLQKMLGSCLPSILGHPFLPGLLTKIQAKEAQGKCGGWRGRGGCWALSSAVWSVPWDLLSCYSFPMGPNWFWLAPAKTSKLLTAYKIFSRGWQATSKVSHQGSGISGCSDHSFCQNQPSGRPDRRQCTLSQNHPKTVPKAWLIPSSCSSALTSSSAFIDFSLISSWKRSRLLVPKDCSSSSLQRATSWGRSRCSRVSWSSKSLENWTISLVLGLWPVWT